MPDNQAYCADEHVRQGWKLRRWLVFFFPLFIAGILKGSLAVVSDLMWPTLPFFLVVDKSALCPVCRSNRFINGAFIMLAYDCTKHVLSPSINCCRGHERQNQQWGILKLFSFLSPLRCSATTCCVAQAPAVKYPAVRTAFTLQMQLQIGSTLWQ